MTYQPPNQPGPFGPPPSQSPPFAPAKPSPKWPWIAGIVAAFVFGICIGAVGSGAQEQPTAHLASPTPSLTPSAVESATPTQASPSASASPSPKLVVMPNLVGENASVAADKLRQLGFTTVEFGSADEDDTVVVLPQNWTVKSQSPKAGKKVSTDQLVVLTCTKQR